MKKILLTFGIALFGFSVALAQDSDIMQEENAATETEAVEQADPAQTGRESIDKEELPTAVRNAVKSGKYETMKIKEAYRLAAGQTGQTGGNMASASYEVVLEGQEGQTTTVTLNEEGQIIKSDDSQ